MAGWRDSASFIENNARMLAPQTGWSTDSVACQEDVGQRSNRLLATDCLVISISYLADGIKSRHAGHVDIVGGPYGPLAGLVIRNEWLRTGWISGGFPKTSQSFSILLISSSSDGATFERWFTKHFLKSIMYTDSNRWEHSRDRHFEIKQNERNYI